MPKVELLDNNETEETYYFYCSGCGGGHFFRVRSSTPGVPLWSWNWDFEKPTINPSIDVMRDNPSKRCHFYVENGQIKYLGDSYHHLKNQTVDMEEVD